MSVDIPRLNKRDFELLGRVFEREISNLLPAQIGKSKAITSLEERGYIKRMAKVLPPPPFPLTIHGWELTEAGRLTYCANCPKE